MVRYLLILLLLANLPKPVQAGAWMRDKGTAFTALSFTLNMSRDMARTTYLEYGLRDDLTVGLDAGMFTDMSGMASGHGTLFLRRPMRPDAQNNKWAYEVGIGADWMGETVAPHLKTGLSWGRGIKIGQKYGWASIDASVRWSLGSDAHVGKIDATVGLNVTDTLAGILQIYLSHIDGDTATTLAPSVVIKPRKGKYRFQIGFEAPMEDATRTAIKVGLWRDF